MKVKPKAIFFDSGHTLNAPRTGQWFIPPSFVPFFENELEKKFSRPKIMAAFAKADVYWDGHLLIETEQEEYDHFKNFYSLFFQSLGYSCITDELITGLAQETVYGDERYEFFDDVFTMLPQLAQRFRLGIISNAWPSLESVYIKRQLRNYFSTFIISSKIGTPKPDPKMFYAALEDLQLSPTETVLVDDNLRNLEGAYALGIQPILIDRANRIPNWFLKAYGIKRFLTRGIQDKELDLKSIWNKQWPFPKISNLSELESIL
jgi:putative hydrolase of the HAD superfamily